MNLRRVMSTSAAIVVMCMALSACSSSIGSGTDPFSRPIGSSPHSSESTSGQQSENASTLGAPEPSKGSGTITIGVTQEEKLPDSVIEAFHQTTGYDVVQQVIESAFALDGQHIDAVLGIDRPGLVNSSAQLATDALFSLTPTPGTEVAATPSALAYGRNDVCVLIDKAWMSVNGYALPSGLETLRNPGDAASLIVPDPASSDIGRAFVDGVATSYGEEFSQWVDALKAASVMIANDEAALAAWTGTSLTGGAEAQKDAAELSGAQTVVAPAKRLPYMVGPMRELARTTSNTGIESQGVAMGSSCVTRYLYIAPTAQTTQLDGVRSLAAWLLSWDGQHALAQDGVVYPLEESAGENTPASWFMTPQDDAITVNEPASNATTWALDQWRSALAG